MVFVSYEVYLVFKVDFNCVVTEDYGNDEGLRVVGVFIKKV